MRRLSFLILLFATFSLFAQIPEGYYDAAAGKTGAELKAALHNIIKGNVYYPYSSSTSTDVWDILKKTDQDPNNPNNVIEIYCGKSVNGPLEYNDGKGWTREHVWAKSRGSLDPTHPGPGTDVHNLKPADPTMNALRSNRWFAQCSKPVYLDGVFTGCFTSDSQWVWEPRKDVRGDVARIIFYMAVRYEGDNGEPDLEVIDSIPSDIHTTLPIHAKLSDLLKWNHEDPVDSFERHRNDVIYQYQHNRNPFIDHPEYADMIWGTDTSGSTNKAPNAPTNLTLTANSSSLSLSWDDVNNETGYYVFRSTDENYFYPIDTLSANTVNYSDNTVNQGTTYYYYVKAFNNYGTSNASNVVKGQLENTSTNYATDLFFSEYVEGSSYNKALEISNFTGHDIDLSNYVIKKQTNGTGDWSTGLQLSGIIHNGESYVIANSSASQTVLDKANLKTSAAEMSFNGNDPVSLWKNGKLIDIIGNFNDGSYFAKDVTLIRKPDVSSPSTTYKTDQWIEKSQDYFDNLGTHTYTGSSDQQQTCDIPTGLNATNITYNSAQLSWSQVSSAQSYTLNYKQTSQTTWQSVTVTTNSYQLTNLQPNTEYEFKVATNCSSGTSDFSSTYSFTTAAAPVEYCEPSGYTRYEWIDYVEISDMSNTSGASDDGYSDFTDKIIHLTPGESYPIYFRAGFRYNMYTEYWQVWIDFNHDGDFDDSGELLGQGYTTDDYTYYMYIDIPSDASGITRLRIKMNDDGYHSACYDAQYGEAEDYTVYFSGTKTHYIPNSNVKQANHGKPDFSLVTPNPACKYINIATETNSTVEIYSLQGQLVKKQITNGQHIDVSTLPSGIYIIKVFNGEKTYHQRLIIRH